MPINRRRFVASGLASVASVALPDTRVQNRNTFVVAPNCYPGTDFAQFLDFVRQTPLRSVELPVGADGPNNLVPDWLVDAPLDGKWRNSLPDLKQLLAQNGIGIACLGAAGYIGHPGSERLLRNRIDLAVRLGVPLFNIACGPGADTAVAAPLLRDAGLYARQQGVRLALETWGELTRNAEACLRTRRETAPADIGINVDTGNVLLGNPDMPADALPDQIRRIGKRLAYVHLKDVRRKPGEAPATTILGQGEVDFKSVFAACRELGFYGPFGLDLETTKARQARDPRAHHQALLASLDHLRTIGAFAENMLGRVDARPVLYSSHLREKNGSRRLA